MTLAIDSPDEGALSARMLKGWVEHLSQCDAALTRAEEEVERAQSTQLLLEEACRHEKAAAERREAVAAQNAALAAARERHEQLQQQLREAEALERAAKSTLRNTLEEHQARLSHPA